MTDSFQLANLHSGADCIRTERSDLTGVSGSRSRLQIMTVQVCLGYRYALNIGFNLKNKVIFNYFPFPYTGALPIASCGQSSLLVRNSLIFPAPLANYQ